MSLEYGHRADIDADEIHYKTEALGEMLRQTHAVVYDQDLDYKRKNTSGEVGPDQTPELRHQRRVQRVKMFHGYRETLMGEVTELNKMHYPLLLRTLVTGVRKHIQDMTHYMIVLSEQDPSSRIYQSVYEQREQYFRELIAKVLHEKLLFVPDQKQREAQRKRVANRRLPIATVEKIKDMKIAADVKSTYTGQSYTAKKLEAEHFMPFSEVIVERRATGKQPAGVLIMQDMGAETYVREYMPNRPRTHSRNAGFGRMLRKMIGDSQYRGRRIIVEVPGDDLSTLNQLSGDGFLAKSMLTNDDEPDHYLMEYVPPKSK